MYDNEFLNLYADKVVEYLLAIGYLVLFIFYWRWVQGEDAPRRDRQGSRRRS
jgi:hypothetical protein